MPENESRFRDFASRLLAKIYGNLEHERIYSHLFKKDIALEPVSVDAFGLHYLGACLALGAEAWFKACLENGVRDPVIRKIFLKAVTDSFQSPKFLSIAAAFSEALHCEDLKEESPAISLARHVCRKWGLKSARRAGRGKEECLGDFFRNLVEIFEGFRCQIENEIFEFMANARFGPEGQD